MRGQLEAIHIYKYEAIRIFMMAELRISTLRNTYTQNSKINTAQQKLKEEVCFTLKMFFFFF